MIPKLRELLAGALQAAGLDGTTDVWRLAEVWSTALGPLIAKQATPLRLVRGELVVAVADAVWRQELALLAPEIAARLNGAVGRDIVQRIRFVGGDAASPLEERHAGVRRRLTGAAVTRGGGRSGRDTGAPPGSAASGSAARGELEEALRSLAAKRAERLLADATDGRVRRRRT